MVTYGILLLPALSLDTLLVAMALARHGPPLRTVLSLTLAEALAPLVGYGLGALFLGIAPHLGDLLAAVLLLLLGVHLLREAREGGEAPGELLSRGTTILGMAAVALDELGVGVTLPALHVSPLPAVLWLLVQAPVMALLGLWLGLRISAWEPLRYVSGGLILALGVVQAVQAALALAH